MRDIEFKIIYWDIKKPCFELEVDGKKQIEVPKGELRRIFNEMEKFGRLRFKGELNHKKLK